MDAANYSAFFAIINWRRVFRTPRAARLINPFLFLVGIGVGEGRVQKGFRVEPLPAWKNNAYGAGRSPVVRRQAVSFCHVVSILTFTGDVRAVWSTESRCMCTNFFYLFYAEKSKLIPALCPRSVYETLSKFCASSFRQRSRYSSLKGRPRYA